MLSRTRGFTLIEVLVVMVIISIISAVAVLSLGTLGGNSAVKHTAEQLAALADLVSQQAVMRGQEYGLRISPHGYDFLLYDGNDWAPVQDDDLLRARRLDSGVSLSLQLEGTAVTLPKSGKQSDTDTDTDTPSDDKQTLKPQIMLLSSGEITPFEITVSGDDKSGQYRVQGDLLHGIQCVPPDVADGH